jgi:peptidoglycan/xylan/chitin deacetylase (PgdA/CDA1 family)
MTDSRLLLRRIGIRLFDALGLNRLLQVRFAGVGVTIMLHRVVERPSDTAFPGMGVERDFLSLAISEFRRLGFDFVRASEVPARLAAGADNRFVCLTLDDGYRDNLHVALPVFRHYGIPCSIFPTVGFLRDDGTAPAAARSIPIEQIVVDMPALDHLFRRRTHIQVGDERMPCATAVDCLAAEARIRAHIAQQPAPESVSYADLLRVNDCDLGQAMDDAYLTWSELRTLAADPLVEIGSHCLTHRRLSKLSAEEAEAEIALPRHILGEALGRPIRSIVYPYGSRYDAKAREFGLAAAAGYEAGFTTIRANTHPEHSSLLLQLPRLAFSMAPHGRSLAFIRGIARGGQHAVLNRFRRVVA